MFCDFAVLVACATGFCIDRKTRVFDRFGVQNPITPAIVGFDLIDDRCTFGWALNAISDFVWGMVLQIMMGCKKMVAKTVCCNWRRKTKWRWISAQRLRFRQMLIAVVGHGRCLARRFFSANATAISFPFIGRRFRFAWFAFVSLFLHDSIPFNQLDTLSRWDGKNRNVVRKSSQVRYRSNRQRTTLPFVSPVAKYLPSGDHATDSIPLDCALVNS